MTPDLPDVCRRLERLERQNHRLKIGMLVAVLAAGVGLLAAADKPAEPKKPDPVLLSDDAGKKRAGLEMTKNGPALIFFDAAGKDRGHITLTDEGMVARFTTERGVLSAGLALQKQGVSVVSVQPGDPPQIGVNAIRQTAGTAFTNDLRPAP